MQKTWLILPLSFGFMTMILKGVSISKRAFERISRCFQALFERISRCFQVLFERITRSSQVLFFSFIFFFKKSIIRSAQAPFWKDIWIFSSSFWKEGLQIISRWSLSRSQDNFHSENFKHFHSHLHKMIPVQISSKYLFYCCFVLPNHFVLI